MTSLRLALLSLLIPLPASGQSPFPWVSLDSLAIVVEGTSRPFAYTNKESAFFYSETNAEHTSGWQGFNVFGHEFLEDYEVGLDGRTLDRTRATAIAYPDYLKRLYDHGVTEELHPVDSLAGFLVTIESPHPQPLVDVRPFFTDGTSAEDYVIADNGAAVSLGRKAHLARTAARNYPVWLALYAPNATRIQTTLTRGRQFSPFSLRLSSGRRCMVAFAVADSRDDAQSLARSIYRRAGQLMAARRLRIERLLNESYVQTSDRRFDKALAWAKISLDALIMNQVAKGIFAGLPWFNNYWGRDTFISLPGATLVTGHFREAREILLSFARFQQTDTSSSDFGRIPNIVTTTDKAYNTADGTPRFVMMAREYVSRSGDSSFAHLVYPVIRRSIEGTLLRHTDSLGLLTHGQAETWMDAVGPDGPWSPRGNRANDIQALWLQQLQAGVWFATLNKDPEAADRWNRAMEQCRTNFDRFFVSDGGRLVVDHLNPDGTPDVKLRPNQIFVSPMLDDDARAHVLQTVVKRLTYVYGVSSLSQEDEDFHPYHQHEPYYPKDAAYHNGTVWTWLQGPVISELCYFNRPEMAYQLTNNTVHQILARGAVGTQSELLDAVPRPGETEPQLSGTFSQAWNPAEFIRNFYDDYLGVRIDRLTHTLTLRPRLPSGMALVNARINLDGKHLDLTLDARPDSVTFTFSSFDLRKKGTTVVEWPTKPDSIVRARFTLDPKAAPMLVLKGNDLSLVKEGVTSSVERSFAGLSGTTSLGADLAFLQPLVRPGLRALRQPDYPLLMNHQIKSASQKASRLLDAADPAGDDTGRGGYSYPRNPAFLPGILDLRRFRVNYDTLNAYFDVQFEALANPAWHPEYGFQLTYIAIAIDQDGVAGSGARRIPQNAHYPLDASHWFERLILVGGGLQVQDATGKVLAAYLPASSDVRNPLGDAHTRTVSFAVPRSLLGEPSDSWTFTVAVGAQDDHGGAGIGEFRSVRVGEASEWTGGGKKSEDDPNVYDDLVVKAGNAGSP